MIAVVEPQPPGVELTGVTIRGVIHSSHRWRSKLVRRAAYISRRLHAASGQPVASRSTAVLLQVGCEP